MPTFLRSLLLALALALVVFGCRPTPGGTTDRESAAGRRAPAKPPPYPLVKRPVTTQKPKRKPKPSLGARAARIALQAVGVQYQWGGASMTSGFDCSGLVYWAYRRLGIELPHSSYALYDRGRRVPRSRLKAGDLLFFFGLGHVGLYLGHGRMVHAPSSGRTVEVVSLRRSYFRDQLIGARRVVSA
ncbi:MAG: C40 family peptidase [Gaiellaceae bacterium]